MQVVPVPPIASDIIVDTETLFTRCLGKKCQEKYNKRKRGKANQCVWKKRSIFFTLTYWKDHKLRHNLDVMRIEKNVMDNILGTLLNVKGWTKDNYKGRLDLAKMGIRRELHLQWKGDDKYMISPACFHMIALEKDGFLQVLRDVKVPDGYASNISCRVNLKERKISGLKSHDNHILMQQLFPIALWGSLPSHVIRPLIKLACFFRKICLKTLNGIWYCECWGRHCSDVVWIGKDISFVFLHCDGTFGHALSYWSQDWWSSSVPLDVPNWEVSYR